MLNARRALLLLLSIAAACSPAVPTLAPTAEPTPTPLPTAVPTSLPTATPLVVPLAQEAAPQAGVRVIHAAPDLSQIDVYVEGLAVAPYLSYRQYTGITPVAAGAYRVLVYPAGSRPGDAQPLAATTAIDFASGSSQMVVIAGSVDDLAIIIRNDTSEPLDQGQSRVTFAHVLTGVGDVTVQQNGVNLTTPLALGQSSTIQSTPAGDITIDFVSAGAALVTYPLNMRQRTAYTLVLAGTPAAPEVIRVEARVPGRATVRAVSGAPAIGPVDLYLNDILLASALDYTRSTPRETLTAGAYRADVYPAGANRTDAEALISADITVGEDDNITLVVLGSPENWRLISVRDDLSQTAPGVARVTFVNTLPAVPRLSPSVSGPPLKLSFLGYGDLARPVDVRADASYTFYWNDAEAGETASSVEIAQNVVFEAGRSYLYLVTGRGDAPPVVLSESVGVQQELADLPPEVTPSPTPSRPAFIRVVNAAFGSGPLDVLLDGLPLAERLDYGNISAAQPAREGIFTVEVRAPGTAEPLFEDRVLFDSSVSYTLVTIGYGLERILILPVPEPELSVDDVPLARLINVTASAPINLGLAYAISVNPSAATSRFSSPPSTDDLSDTAATPTYRQSIGFGVQPILNADSVPPGGASAPGLLPEGEFDILILDADAAAIAATIANLRLESGQRYDVYALQQPDSRLVQGFVVPVLTNPG